MIAIKLFYLYKMSNINYTLNANSITITKSLEIQGPIVVNNNTSSQLNIDALNVTGNTIASSLQFNSSILNVGTMSTDSTAGIASTGSSFINNPVQIFNLNLMNGVTLDFNNTGSILNVKQGFIGNDGMTVAQVQESFPNNPYPMSKIINVRNLSDFNFLNNQVFINLMYNNTNLNYSSASQVASSFLVGVKYTIINLGYPIYMTFPPNIIYNGANPINEIVLGNMQVTNVFGQSLRFIYDGTYIHVFETFDIPSVGFS